MKKIFISILLLNIISYSAILAIDPPKPTVSYANRMVLAEPNVYILYWNYSENDILFETHVQNSGGWSGFGISPNGKMDNSDVIVTWMKTDRSVHFTGISIFNFILKLSFNNKKNHKF